MGPGGNWNFGSPPVQYTGGQRRLGHNLTLKEVGHFIATGAIGLTVANPVVSVGLGLVHWNYHILRPLGEDVYAEIVSSLPTYGDLSSSGRGGPGEYPTSTASPLSLEQIGKASEHTSSPAAAGNSAHGGRRSGSKPRKKCPPLMRWSTDLKKCVNRQWAWQNNIR